MADQAPELDRLVDACFAAKVSYFEAWNALMSGRIIGARQEGRLYVERASFDRYVRERTAARAATTTR